MHAFDWRGLWLPKTHPAEVILRAAIAYLFVQAIFRIVGRKELGRYSTFDVAVLFLVSVAMRETIVGDDHSITSGALGLGTIVGLDWFLSWLSFKSQRAAKVIEGDPRPLIRNGRVLDEELHRSRVSKEHLLAELHTYGRESLDEVIDAFLERSGRVTFVLRDRAPLVKH